MFLFVSTVHAEDDVIGIQANSYQQLKTYILKQQQKKGKDYDHLVEIHMIFGNITHSMLIDTIDDLPFESAEFDCFPESKAKCWFIKYQEVSK
jgi:hypothetical protein